MFLRVPYFLLLYLCFGGLVRANNAHKTLKMTLSNGRPQCQISFDGRPVREDGVVTVETGTIVIFKVYTKSVLNGLACVPKDIDSFYRRNYTYEDAVFGPPAPGSTSGFNTDQSGKTLTSFPGTSKTSAWTCEALSNSNTQGFNDSSRIITSNGITYWSTICKFYLNFTNETSKTSASELSDPDKQKYIFIGVGVLVAIIIAAQTAIIVYCVARARKMERLRRISQRVSSDDNTDNNRYIKSTQCTNVKTRLFGKNKVAIEEDIYEVLTNGETTPPVPPIENIPTLKYPKTSRSESPDVSTLPKQEDKRRRVPTPDLSSLQRLPAGRDKSSYNDISTRPRLSLPHEDVPDSPQNTLEKNAKRPIINIPTTTVEEDTVIIPGLQQRMVQIRPPPSKGSSGVNPITKGNIRQMQNPVQSTIANELGSKLKMRQHSLAQGINPASPENSKTVSSSKLNKIPATSKIMGSFRRKTPPVTVSPAHEHNFPTTNPDAAGKSAIVLGLAPKPERPVVPKPLPVPKKPPPAAPKPTKPSPAMLRPTRPVEKPIPVLPPPVVKPSPEVLRKPPLPSPEPIPAPSLPPPALPKPPLPIPEPIQVPRPPPPALNPPPIALFVKKPPVQEPAQVPVAKVPPFTSTPPTVTPSITKPPMPPLPSLPLPPNPIEEPVYEEYQDVEEPTEEPLYNSDDEWCYEPLSKYNIYSS